MNNFGIGSSNLKSDILDPDPDPDPGSRSFCELEMVKKKVANFGKFEDTNVLEYLTF